MTFEVFSSTSYNTIWTAKSDVWVILNPDLNPWTEKIDWSLGMLLRRSLLRLELAGDTSKNPGAPILLAAPEGLPATRVLILPKARGDDAAWLAELAPILTKMRVSMATVFAPKDWRPPSLKVLTESSRGEWGIRWVESAG